MLNDYFIVWFGLVVFVMALHSLKLRYGKRFDHIVFTKKEEMFFFLRCGQPTSCRVYVSP